METNRDYYSWSQHSLFTSSPLSFYKKYTLGEDDLKLPAFDKGKEFCDYREKGEIPYWVDDPLLIPVSKTIPSIGICEKKIEVKLGDINLLAFIDECKDDLTEFAEYKTGRIDGKNGKAPWNQIEVDNHEQLDFYAVCIYLLSNEKIIPKCKLYWIETEEVIVLGEKKLMYTGAVNVFEREFDQEDIIAMASKILSTYDEIQNYIHEEIDLDKEFDNDIVERFIELIEQKKSIESEMNLIKLNVLDILNSYGSKYASNELGRFSRSIRKTAYYSADINKKIDDFKININKLKNKEKNNGTVVYTESETILFKAKKQN